jgi:hypothetical protein
VTARAQVTRHRLRSARRLEGPSQGRRNRFKWRRFTEVRQRQERRVVEVPPGVGVGALEDAEHRLIRLAVVAPVELEQRIFPGVDFVTGQRPERFVARHAVSVPCPPRFTGLARLRGDSWESGARQRHPRGGRW